MSEFLALLRSFIHDTPPEGAQTWDIAALSQTALRQNLLPVLAYENKRWQLFAADDVKKQLTRSCTARSRGTSTAARRSSSCPSSLPPTALHICR